MIIDSSAIVAVLNMEHDASRFRDAIYDADAVRVSAAGYVEVGALLDRRGLGSDFDRFLGWCNAEIAPVTLTQANIARRADERYGRRSGHPASLNYGDCFPYALAVERGESLLFKGNDFVHTDVLAAL